MRPNLGSDGGAAERERMINAITTNLTGFFREPHHFEFLEQRMLPAMPVGWQRLRIWSAGCSSGEEPYSIAMSLVRAMPGIHGRDARILATDIDTEALAKARRGIYPQEQVRKLDEARVKRFFQKGTGNHIGLARVRPEVSALVEFMPLNLLAPQWPVKGPFDAIFCRNVMIYFDKPTQLALLRRFAPLLNPGGLLFVGHSENFSQSRELFTLLGKTVYEVVPEAACKQNPRMGNA